MMRSLYSGISGLKNHQTRMDVIANNISNVNTTGYVASRVVFKDVFSQTSRYASGSSAATGGTNPIQIGLGVTLSTIDMLHGTANYGRSDRELDFTINGDGFFIININNSAAADGAAGEPILRYSRAGNFYWDSNGDLVNGDGYFVMGVAITPVEYDGTDIREGDLYYTTDTGGDSTARQSTADLTKINGKAHNDIVIDGKGVITGINKETGDKEVLGYLVLSTFENTNGLEKVGNSLYQASNNSGMPTYACASTNGAGELMAGGLEMSNVDLASEFTDMIVTQRGFQANSRIITTSDSMLEELVNLKR